MRTKPNGIFRAKGSVTGEWITGSLVETEHGCRIVTVEGKAVEVERYTAGQYTGGTMEKNGHFLFEGDVVEILNTGKLAYCAWDSSEKCFIFNEIETGDATMVGGYNPDSYKVVGDLYDGQSVSTDALAAWAKKMIYSNIDDYSSFLSDNDIAMLSVIAGKAEKESDSQEEGESEE